MAKEGRIYARIDEKLKERAAKVLSKNGLTISEAIEELMVYLDTHKSLPFVSKKVQK